MELTDLITLLVGAGSIFVAVLVYRNSKRQQRDAWLREYTEVYHAFWNDDEMREVRSWIANDDAFTEAREVLSRREHLHLTRSTAEGDQLTRAEYVYIDKLDRFLSLMTRMVSTGKEFKSETQFWGTGLWEFWLRACFRIPEFRWYIEAFWIDLFEYCRRTFSPERDPMEPRDVA